ncbi:class I SAM-dependent methyltransferase [Rossellomorea vietnamensis]|uniref:Class I SAM-dependent methyltransferase n=1 Tax=Rossellomorea vietnamensis TaxID=218284 RepID=A0A5D4ME27_9BACI|nr:MULTISPECIES: class I SAM-dependent methyltransferase [Bacillaceae]TYR99285.1 class I SAM-dependent methyltransferase [Rossellomorea vietnamensis]
MNKWDERYKQDKYVYGTEPNIFMKNAMAKSDLSGEVLAIAEGEGRNAVYLASQGMNVTSWDYAASGLAKTKKLALSKKVQVHTELIDLEKASFKQNHWDGVVCIFGHFPEDLRQKTLQGIKETVKPGGYFVSEVYSIFQIPYKSGGPKEETMLYRPEDFLNTFHDWKIIHFFMGEVTRHEGDLHNGLSHVIQFIGQKQ